MSKITEVKMQIEETMIKMIRLMRSYNPDLPMAPGMKAQFLELRDRFEEQEREGLAVVKSPDANVELNRELLLQRSMVGLQKYGVTTERTDLTPAQWAQHAIEEALDFANYLQALKRNLEDVRELIASVVGQCESGFLPDGETMWAMNEFLKLTEVQGKAP
jgi:hypothetical protein